jgi:RimJ/RimL family protein N-acetyltransferase
MAGKLVVETQRLLLREYVSEDAEATFVLGSNPLVQRYTGDACFRSVEEAEAVILRHPIEDYRKYGFGRWAVVFKPDGRLIGMAGLKYLAEWDEVDLGLVHPANLGSIRVLEKCGLTFEKMVEVGSQPVAQYAIHSRTD